MCKIGVFIDADNISAHLAEKAILKLASLGDICFVKAYGNWSRKPSIWKQLANQYGIETMHRYNITRSKNAADILLTVEATASLYGSMQFDTLAVVSSDSDFLPLVQHAQSCGKYTVGVGCRKAPSAYTRRCAEFHYLDEPSVIELEAVSK